VIELLVHNFSQLELLGRAELVERVLALIKDLFFSEDGISVLKAVLQKASELILLLLLLLIQFIHFE